MSPATSALAGAAAAAGVRGTDMWFDPAFEAEFNEFVAEKNITFVAKAAAAYDAAVVLMDAFRRAAEPKGGPEVRVGRGGGAPGRAGWTRRAVLCCQQRTTATRTPN
jgi:hypothetical protein